MSAITLGEIKPPARKLGQADHVFMVEALLDGESAEGIPVNVLFASGDSIEGVTDNTGTFGVSYGPGEFGRAFVKITPPAGVEDMGRGTTKEVVLSEDDLDFVTFNMSTPQVANGGAPTKTRDLVTALAVTALMTLIGVNASAN